MNVRLILFKKIKRMGCTDSKPKRPSKTQNRGSNVNYTTQENAEGAPKSNAASHIPIQKPV